MTTDHFRGKEWALAGKFHTVPRTELAKALRERGSTIARHVSGRTHYLISASYNPTPGTLLSRQEELAQRRKIPILSEKQCLEVLAGEDLENVLGKVPKADKEVMRSQNALAKLRELLYEEPDEGNWAGICEILDRCAPEDLSIAFSYVLQARPDLEEEHYDTPESLQNAQEARTLPRTWSYEVLRGENPSKLSLVRSANLSNRGLNGKSGAVLLQSTAMCNLRVLSLKQNKLSMGFWEKLGAAKHLQELLVLEAENTRFNRRASESLAKSSFSAGLRALDLRNSIFVSGFSDLFAKGAFPRLHTLCLAGVLYEMQDLFLAFSHATHLTELRSLDLSNIYSSPSGFERMVNAPHLQSLTHLRLDYLHFEPGMLSVLARSGALENLESLEILNDPDRLYFRYERSDVYYTTELIEVLGALSPDKIKHLSLEVPPPVLEALLGSTQIDKLQTLFFRELNCIDGEMIAEADEKYGDDWNMVEERNKAKIAGARAFEDLWSRFLEAPHMKNLEVLEIEGGTSEKLQESLFQSSNFPSLRSYNGIERSKIQGCQTS